MPQLAELRQRADALLQQGRPEDFSVAADLLRNVIGGLSDAPGSASTTQALAGAWINYGNARLREDNRANLLEARAAYRSALALFAQLPPGDPEQDLEHAAAWNNLGQSYQLEDSAAAWNQAADAYRRAWSILAALPASPRQRHHLAATGLNLANCHLVQGQPAEAVAAYEAAEAALTGPEPTEPGQSFAALRLRIWTNRASAWADLPQPEAHARATADLERAEACLRSHSAHPLTLAQVLANRAQLLSRQEGNATALQTGLDAAREAIKLLQPGYAAPNVAEWWLQAQRAAIQCLTLLVPLCPAGTDPDRLYFEASDRVDAALLRFRQCFPSDPARFRDIGRRLFHLGTQLYAHAQPQFLAEFIAENLDPAQVPAALAQDPELQASAHAALEATLNRLRHHTPLTLDQAPTRLRLIDQLALAQARFTPRPR